MNHDICLPFCKQLFVISFWISLRSVAKVSIDMAVLLLIMFDADHPTFLSPRFASHGIDVYRSRFGRHGFPTCVKLAFNTSGMMPHDMMPRHDMIMITVDNDNNYDNG